MSDSSNGLATVVDKEEQDTKPVQVQKKQEPSLDALVTAIGPLAQAFLSSEERKHHRTLEFEERAMTIQHGRDRVVLIVAALVVVVLLVIAGILFYAGRDTSAITLISFVVGSGGAGLGGYGIAVKRQARTADDDEG